MANMTIHYGPIYDRDPGESVALCHPIEWAIMTVKRDMVNCPQCVSLLTPRECSICRLTHGREVEHANE